MVETTPTNSTTSYSNICVHRLPCGYCPLMSRQCPMQNTLTWSTPLNVPTINYNDVTCQSNTEVAHESI